MASRRCATWHPAAPCTSQLTAACWWTCSRTTACWATALPGACSLPAPLHCVPPRGGRPTEYARALCVCPRSDIRVRARGTACRGCGERRFSVNVYVSGTKVGTITEWAAYELRGLTALDRQMKVSTVLVNPAGEEVHKPAFNNTTEFVEVKTRY